MANFPLLCQRNQSVQYEFCACFEAAELSKRVGYTAKIIRFSYVFGWADKTIHFGIIWWEKMWSSVVPFLPSSCFFRGKWVEILQSDPWKSIGHFPLNPHDSGRNGSIWYMDVSKNNGTSKWMVYNGNPYKHGWFGGTIIFGNHHLVYLKGSVPAFFFLRQEKRCNAWLGGLWRNKGEVVWSRDWEVRKV